VIQEIVVLEKVEKKVMLEEIRLEERERVVIRFYFNKIPHSLLWG
jgi:hypothetical protein